MSSRPDGYRPLLLSGGLHASAARWPTKTALICEGVERTFGELSCRVRRIAGAAKNFGLHVGDRVALIAPNCIEYPELVCGLSDAGAIVATINPRSTAAELEKVCINSGARAIFAHPSLAQEATVAAAKSSAVERVILLGPEYEKWVSEAPQAAAPAILSETDPFTLVYSSGTTGQPKGVIVSHRSRVLTFHGMAMEYGCYGPDDHHLGIAPMAHGAGFAFIMATIYFGGTVEVLPKFDPELVLRKLSNQPFTGVFMVPTHFQSIFALESALLSRYRGKSAKLRTIISNAAALPQAAKEKIVDFWGAHVLHETYGATEGGIITNLRPAHQLTRKGSVGMSFALNEIRLLDDSGADVPPGDIGELHCRSPYLFNGYWQQHEETTRAMRDGWLTVGDLARRDEAGFIYIVDRKSDMVVTGGFNVYPREIEEALHQHPAVLEAAVVGTPDDHWGEALRAFVAIRGGFNLSKAELETFCRRTLAGYKIPKEFFFIEALPRNTAGKIVKTSLKTCAPQLCDPRN